MQAIGRWQTEQHDPEAVGKTQTNRISGKNEESRNDQEVKFSLNTGYSNAGSQGIARPGAILAICIRNEQ
jgi:hypothetical protein